MRLKGEPIDPTAGSPLGEREKHCRDLRGIRPFPVEILLVWDL